MNRILIKCGNRDAKIEYRIERERERRERRNRLHKKILSFVSGFESKIKKKWKSRCIISTLKTPSKS